MVGGSYKCACACGIYPHSPLDFNNVVVAILGHNNMSYTTCLLCIYLIW